MMSATLFLLLIITFLYAGYNLLIKVSSGFVPITASSTILATIALQLAALVVSCLFATGLLVRGASALSLPTSAYVWAVLAGICIGGAEIGYFYLFRGIAGAPPLAANIAIPFIVSGTIVVTALAAWLTFNESLSWQKGFGIALIIIGVITIYLDKKPAGLVG